MPERILAWREEDEYIDHVLINKCWGETSEMPYWDATEYVRADLMAELVGLLQEARTDLQSYVDHDYPPETCAAHPSVARQHFRDMELCRRIAAALAKLKEPQT